MTSIAAPVRDLAERVAAVRRTGASVIVVLSARGSEATRLLDLTLGVGATGPAREIDQLLATGECASAALLAMALHAIGVPTVALTGDQAGVLAAGKPGAGAVTSVSSHRVGRLLSEGYVVVTGSHGVNAEGDIVALGRAGSAAFATVWGPAVRIVDASVDDVVTPGGARCW